VGIQRTGLSERDFLGTGVFEGVDEVPFGAGWVTGFGEADGDEEAVVEGGASPAGGDAVGAAKVQMEEVMEAPRGLFCRRAGRPVRVRCESFGREGIEYGELAFVEYEEFEGAMGGRGRESGAASAGGEEGA
jgi:hypothetical protein